MKTRVEGTSKALAIMIASALAAFAVGGCVSAMRSKQERNPSSSAALPEAIARDRYLSRVQPIFDNRCVVCHSCVDAPCQLQLTSYDAARRGAVQLPPLVGSRLQALPPSRMKDASSLAEWRKKGFFEVVSDGARSRERSLLYRLIEDGLTANASKAPAALRDTPACAKEYQHHDGIGMPYGLPGLSADEFRELTAWMEEGAPGPSDDARRALAEASHPATVARWEEFFNQHTVKSQIVSRYIYEHAFTAHLHFTGDAENEFYDLIRSDEAPGHGSEKIHELVSKRPYDAVTPKSGEPIYYRLRRVTDTIVQKTHIVWELDDAKLARFRQLFFETPWSTETPVNPGFGITNPFRAFVQIPAESRATFMIENSKLIIEAMIRGPVCTGRVASYAIRDHFWIFFLKPEADVSVKHADLEKSDWPALDSREFIKHTIYRKEQNAALKKFLKSQGRNGFELEDIWDGDGVNRNAILTVLRHEASASVHLGPIGGKPMTSWVLSYSNFERLYYNLVADFMPWGNLSHRLSTWTFMSFLRTEAEERFLQFLPVDPREDARSKWNRGWGSIASIGQGLRDSALKGGVKVNPSAPVDSLLSKFVNRMTPEVRGSKDSINGYASIPFAVVEPIRSKEDVEQTLSLLASRHDRPFVRFLPNVSVLMVSGTDLTYSLIANRGYKYNNNFAFESMAREEDKDELIALPGVIGSYPELIFDLPIGKIEDFLGQLYAIKTLEDWKKVKLAWSVRRTSKDFWPTVDRLTARNAEQAGVHAGVLDLSRYDIADEVF